MVLLGNRLPVETVVLLAENKGRAKGEGTFGDTEEEGNTGVRW